MWVPVDDLFAILRNQLLIATAVPCASSLGNCPASIPNGTTYYPVGSTRSNPALGTSSQISTIGVSNFNAFVADLSRRFGSGWAVRANYTYAKSLDDWCTNTMSDCTSSRSPGRCR